MPIQRSANAGEPLERLLISENAQHEQLAFDLNLSAQMVSHMKTNRRKMQPVNPYEQKLKITVDSLTVTGDWFELENTTTEEVFRVNENATGKRIVIDGPNVTADNLAYYRKTNRRFISLAPGWNTFVVRNTSARRVTVDFVFYYD